MANWFREDIKLFGCQHVHGAPRTRNTDANRGHRNNIVLQTSSTEGRTPITDAYWPTLKKILMEDPSARDCLDLECCICYDRITVHDDEHTVQNLSDFGNTTHEPCVLPCGHIMGLSCMRKMVLDDQERDRLSQCPCCRFSLTHESCEHPVAQKVIAWDNLDKMPLTVPEGGDKRGQCFSCHLNLLGLALAEYAYFDFKLRANSHLHVGVLLSTCCQAETYNIAYAEDGLPYQMFPFHTGLWQERLDTKLNCVLAAHQKSWVNVDLESVRADLGLFRLDELEHQGRENNAMLSYAAPSAQEDLRG